MKEMIVRMVLCYLFSMGTAFVFATGLTYVNALWLRYSLVGASVFLNLLFPIVISGVHWATLPFALFHVTLLYMLMHIAYFRGRSLSDYERFCQELNACGA